MLRQQITGDAGIADPAGGYRRPATQGVVAHTMTGKLPGSARVANNVGVNTADNVVECSVIRHSGSCQEAQPEISKIFSRRSILPTGNLATTDA
jgi:hypothetical protein